MSDRLFRATLRWVRNGAGPELDCPHSLFELGLDEGHPRIADRRQCLRLLRTVQFDPDEDERLALEGGDVFEVFAVFVLLLQRRAGHAVARRLILPQAASRALAAVEHIWAPAAQGAAPLAAQLVSVACHRLVATDEAQVKAVLAYEKACGAGPCLEHRYFYVEARRRGLPVELRPPIDLVLGQGRHQRRLRWLMTDLTSHLAVRLARNKTLTLRALRDAGLPVPRHIPVETLEDAQHAAQRLGFPVVVKPIGTDRGVGITVGITSAAALGDAYRLARQHDPAVAIETFVPGETFRLMVVNGRFIAAARTTPTPLVGDGKHTVQEIVAHLNRSVMRGPGQQKPLCWMDIDEEAVATLRSQSLTPDTVLPAGKVAYLRTMSNLSRGGQSISVTDQVHPHNRALAETCAKIVGLELAGIDFRTRAIDRSWRDGFGTVIEVNTGPGLRMHIQPAVGQGADLATPIFDMLFPDGAPSRVPIVAVTGTNGKTTTTRMVAHALRRAGFFTGLTTTDDMVVDGRIIKRGDCAGAAHARHVLAIKAVEAAVLETARGGLIKYGLGFDRCSVAVVTNIAADHLGEDGVETLEDLARVKLVVPLSAEQVVLNADNAHCLAMRAALAGRRIVLFSTDPANPAVKQHVDGGGTAFVLSAAGQTETILRLAGDGATSLMPVEEIPITFHGSARHNVENALAALAALHCLGIPDGQSCESARQFRPDPACNSGRLNLLPGFPFEVFVDYAHNRHGFEAIASFASRRHCAGRKLCVVTMNASRISGATAHDAMTALAGHFDHYVTCNHDAPLKRREGFAALLQQGLRAAAVPEGAVSVCDGEDEAIDLALALARPGDLVMLLIGYEPQRIIERLRNRAAGARDAPAT